MAPENIVVIPKALPDNSPAIITLGYYRAAPLGPTT
jgi:hypothetical protein